MTLAIALAVAFFYALTASKHPHQRTEKNNSRPNFE